MKVKGESCLCVGRAVRKLKVSGTPSELLLSLISHLYRRIFHFTAENTLTYCQFCTADPLFTSGPAQAPVNSLTVFWFLLKTVLRKQGGSEMSANVSICLTRSTKAKGLNAEDFLSCYSQHVNQAFQDEIKHSSES